MRLGRDQRCSDIDERRRQRGVTLLWPAVDDSHLIVIFESAALIGREDGADALHAKGGEFSGPQGTHASATEDVNAATHRPQNLLVPDRRYGREVAVDDPDGEGPALRHAIDIA